MFHNCLFYTKIINYSLEKYDSYINVNRQKASFDLLKKSKEAGLINSVCDAGIILTE